MAEPEPGSSPTPAVLHVTVVHAPAPRVVRSWALRLAAGSTALQALQACGVLHEYPELTSLMNRDALSVWGQRCDASRLLQDGDRVEVCRPLRVDPKVARRTRFAQQGARATGLFARRRPGAKAGY